MMRLLFIVLSLSLFVTQANSRSVFDPAGGDTFEADPTDCAANTFSNAISINGDLGCVAISDADVPDGITVNLSATSTSLAADPTDCAANAFATTIAASGNLSCSQVDVVNGTTGTLPVSRGGTGLVGSPGNGQVPIGNGSGYALGTLTGTNNRVLVANGAGTITLSTPQDLHSGASPGFAGLTLAGTWQVGDPGAKPTCDSSQRGKLFHDFGGVGVKDTIEICGKDAGDLYAWRVIY